MGIIVQAMFLSGITDQYMDVIDYSTNVTTRYIKSTSWVLKCWTHPTFSRHGNAQASFALLIWL